jgi:hypothetical protein
MRKPFLSVMMVILAVLVSGLWENPLRAQQQLSNPDEYMKGEDFTRILKDEWGYLRDATDGYLGSIEKKSEFETSKEFGDRIAKAKAAFVAKINAHIQEKKFDKRVFGVLFKASLVSYNADQQQYTISSTESIEAPYDIPTLHCIVPRNSFVALTDSVNRGFRTSALRIKFPTNYRWNVARDEAKIAKGEEPNIFFQIRFVIDLRQEDMVKQAKLRIIPTQISMLNPASRKVYWSTDIK